MKLASYISKTGNKLSKIRVASAGVFLLLILSCGDGSNVGDICGCQPSEPDSKDYRHAAKHVPLPPAMPQDIDVNTILGWPQTPDPPNDGPRTGRELQLFHVANAFVQFVWLFHGDCDVHLEISSDPSKNAPRVIVETPVDAEYCSSRRELQAALAQRGVIITTGFQEISHPIPVELVGLAFHDFHHKRGSRFVATVWELHPALVRILP